MSIKKLVLVLVFSLSSCIVEKQYYFINSKGDTLRINPVQDSIRPRPIEHLIF